MKKLTYALAVVLAFTGLSGCKDEQKKNPYAPTSEQQRKTDDAKQF